MDKENLIQLTNKLYKITLLFPKKEPLRYKIREIADEILENFVIWEVFHSSNPTKSKSVDKQELIFALEKNLEILNTYLEITKWQNWVSYFDILEIEEEYDKIKGKIQEEADSFETQKALTLIEKEEAKGLLIEKINKQIEVEREKNENFQNFDIKTAKKRFDLDKPRAFLHQKAQGKPHSYLEEKKSDFSEERFDEIEKQNALNSRKEKILKILREKEKVQVGEISAVFPEVSKRTIRRDFVQLLKQGLIERIGEKNDTFYQLKTQNI